MRTSSWKELVLRLGFASPCPGHAQRPCPACPPRVGWGRGTPGLTWWEVGPRHLGSVPRGSLSKGHDSGPGSVETDPPGEPGLNWLVESGVLQRGWSGVPPEEVASGLRSEGLCVRPVAVGVALRQSLVPWLLPTDLLSTTPRTSTRTRGRCCPSSTDCTACSRGARTSAWWS